MMPVSKPNSSMPPSAPKVKMNALLSGKRVEKPVRFGGFEVLDCVGCRVCGRPPLGHAGFDISIAVAAAPVALVSCAADAVLFRYG